MRTLTFQFNRIANIARTAVLFLSIAFAASLSAQDNVDYHENEMNDHLEDGGVQTVIDPVSTLHGICHTEVDIWLLDPEVFTDEIVIKKITGDVAVKIYESDHPDYKNAIAYRTVASSFSVIPLNPAKYYYLLLSAGSPLGYQIQIANTPTALPVELISFSGQSLLTHVDLNWATASEEGNFGFEIERSVDNESWTNIGFVEGHGDSSEKIEYRFTDAQPQSGYNYYRLRQIDFDGDETLSDIIAIQHRGQQTIDIKMFPNPAVSTLHISFPEGETPTTGTIHDSQGRIIAILPPTNEGIWAQDISQLPAGQYFVSLQTQQGIHSQAFIKQ